MRLFIIRHGDPDYAADSLTEKGWREAELLKNRLLKLDIKAIYCSPLGRAKDTAKPLLEALHQKAEICDWLREFDGQIMDPETGKDVIPWDRKPALLYGHDEYYDKEQWMNAPLYRTGDTLEKYGAVCKGLDSLLEKHGYVHDKNVFRVTQANTENILLFCHYGVECVLLSHLLNVSPVVFWQGFVALPTSVTVLATEERQQGISSFRCSSFGDLSHLYAGNEPASFQARFCEVYSDFTQRH